MERPQPVSGDTEDGRFVLDGHMSAVMETLAAFVCAERPWTSLACVLINSLLVIPSGAACWDPSPAPPHSQARSLAFSFPLRGL